MKRSVLFATISLLSATLLGNAASAAELQLKEEPRPQGITLQNTIDGVVYADKNGKTIYTAGFDNKPGESHCDWEPEFRAIEGHGDRYTLPNLDHRPTCLGQQPIVAAEAGSKPVGQWTIIDRPDGLKQWAYSGRPLYTSVKDFHPGETNLLSLGGRGDFRALTVPVILPPEVLIGQVTTARILTTAEKKLTLYTSAADTNGKSNCEGACATKWHPVLAPEVAKEQGGWTAPRRADGARQWAINGKPLYTFARDVYPGDYRGNGQPGWEVALLAPLTPMPDVIKVYDTVVGPKFTDSRGWTLYVFSCNEKDENGGSGLHTACDTPDQRSHWWTFNCGNVPTCADTWRPVLAAEGAKGDGKVWSVVTLQDQWAPVRAPEGTPGKQAWAYMGVPVFTYKYEDRPGMMEGDLIGIRVSGQWESIDAGGYDINHSKTTQVRAASR